MKISIVSLLCILFLAGVQARLSRTLGLRGNSLSGSPIRRQLESKSMSMSKSKSEKSKAGSMKSKSMSKSKSKSEKSKGGSMKSKSMSKSKSMKSEKSKGGSMKSKSMSKSKSMKSKSKSKSKSKKSKSKSKRIAGGQLSRLGALEGGDFGAAFTPLALGGVSGVPAIEVAAENGPEVDLDSTLGQLAALGGLSSVASPAVAVNTDLAAATVVAPEEPEVEAFSEPAQVVPALPLLGPDPLEQLIARPVVTTTEAAPAAEEAAPAAEEAAPETGPAMTTVQSAGMARLALLGDSF